MTTYSILTLSPTTTAYRNICSISERAAKDTGAKVSYRAPETFDMVAMSQLIDAAVNQEPDGIVVSIPDADALGPSIQKAVAAGIAVVSMNSGSDVSKGLGALLHVGQEEFFAGKVPGEKMASMGRARCRFGWRD